MFLKFEVRHTYMDKNGIDLLRRIVWSYITANSYFFEEILTFAQNENNEINNFVRAQINICISFIIDKSL